MKWKFWFLVFYLICPTIKASHGSTDFLVGQKQIPYITKELSDSQFLYMSQLSNVEHLKETIKEICIPRIVGTPGHKKVRDYIIKSLQDRQWSLELDSFTDTAPIMGNLEFHNVIATLNPHAERYLVLACHYDSKYMPNVKFLGATDSAVPCAMLLNLANVLESHLEAFKYSKLSLMLLFFDGEEAFKKWGPNDSIYGSRHLAKKWEKQNFLQKIDILMLLDLLGAPNPNFYSFFHNTGTWHTRLLNIEQRLRKTANSSITCHNSHNYFKSITERRVPAEDDHIPFLQRNVPVLHIIPRPYPSVWHTIDDNESAIDYCTTEMLSRIIRIFTMEYLLGILDQSQPNDLQQPLTNMQNTCDCSQYKCTVQQICLVKNTF